MGSPEDEALEPSIEGDDADISGDEDLELVGESEPEDDYGEVAFSFDGDEDDDEVEFELDDDPADIEEPVIRPGGTASMKTGSRPSTPAKPGESAESLAADGLDGIDLAPDQRVAIDLAADGIEGKSFYAVLLLPRTADARAIKRAYYKLSKEYHPDKFYRKNLGPYKEKLETIFGKINEAYRVLSDPETRDDYDVLVFGAEGKDIATPTEATQEVNFVPESVRAKQASQTLKDQNRAGGKRRRKKAPPKFMTDFQKQLARRIAKARRHIKLGEEAMEKGEQGEAARHFQAALALDPRNVRARTMYKRMAGQDRNTRAEQFYKQAQDALLAEDHKRAAELMAKAVDCKPTRGKYYNEFGKLVGAHTLQQRVGLELLRKAVELENRNIEYTLDLARAYEELSMPSNAVRAYERVLQLDAKQSEAAKAIKRLK